MEFKATDIAAFLNGEIVGDGSVKVFGVSKIDDGEPGTLAFLSNMKYENFIYETQASVVLVNKSFNPKKEIKSTLIKVDDAYQAFASLLDLYIQTKSNQKIGIEQPSFIHETAKIGDELYLGAFAYIGKNAEIGDGVKIFPQVYVGENVVIGDNCVLYPGVKIYDDCKIGNRCILHGGSVIGADGFGFAPQNDGTYKKIPQIGNVILEDDVEIGANSTIDCSTMDSTIIRKGAKIDNLVQIAHNCEIGQNTVIAAQSGLAGQTGLAGHLSLGDNVTVGAQAGIIKSIKDNETVWGTPSMNIKDQMKALSVFRNLPKLKDDLYQMQKDINQIKNKI